MLYYPVDFNRGDIRVPMVLWKREREICACDAIEDAMYTATRLAKRFLRIDIDRVLSYMTSTSAWT